MGNPLQAAGSGRWQFGIIRLFHAAALVALSLGTYRWVFVTTRHFRTWELWAALMFATGCVLAAVGLPFGRKYAAIGFVVGAGIGGWATWRIMTTGL